MSKQHFEAFARAIREIANKGERKRTAETVAKVCQRFNGGFDKGRFLRACGVQPDTNSSQEKPCK